MNLYLYFSLIMFITLYKTIDSVKLKLIMQSDDFDKVTSVQNTNKKIIERRISKPDTTALLPFIKNKISRKSLIKDDIEEYSDEAQGNKHLKPRRYLNRKFSTTETPINEITHATDLYFYFIENQKNVENAFRVGNSKDWYTWSVGEKSILEYFICHEDPRDCDELGWEKTESLPDCAFQITALTEDDRVCILPFGEASTPTKYCEDEHSISSIEQECGASITSLWRFWKSEYEDIAKTSKTPSNVNELMCDNDDECFVSMEYKIHRDRITLSIKELNSGKTYRGALWRNDSHPTTVAKDTIKYNQKGTTSISTINKKQSNSEVGLLKDKSRKVYRRKFNQNHDEYSLEK